MARDRLSDKVNGLFRRCKWGEARRLLEKERQKHSESHWVLTQLGVTFYEERRYEEALRLFLASQKIVADCPLTLWNLAGALDAIGKHEAAVGIYTWLLESTKSPKQDPCWESAEWTDALKVDCVYRLGVSLQHLGRTEAAEHCYRQYVALLLSGIEGSYPIEEVTRRIQGLHPTDEHGGTERQLKKAVTSVLKGLGNGREKRRRNVPPELNIREMLPGRRAASKR